MIYSLLPTKDGYQFITEEGLWYEVYAVDGGYLLDLPDITEHVKVFGFMLRTEEADANRRYDPRILETIAYVLLRQFDNINTVVWFTCDQTDGYEAARFRLFNRWFRQYNNSIVVKVDKVIDNLYASILFRRDNPFYAEVIRSIDAAEEDILNK